MGQDHSSLVDDSTPPHTLAARTLDAVADYIKSPSSSPNGSSRPPRILVMTGAGISTAAGIPDFRSPNTGLYSNLARLNLPYAEAVFDISYFRTNPEPFYVLAQELYPGKFHPTVSHAFIALLAKKGLLYHLFTQNIDCLEREAGVPPELIVEAHGSFATQRCIDCKTPYPADKMLSHVHRGAVPRCETCNGLVKPDIVFFGEALPDVFREKSHYAAQADIVLILGTSLTVHPFASLPEQVRERAPRVLFNLERVGGIGSRADDVLVLGDCDEGVRRLADKLGWRDELEKEWRRVVGDEEAERQIKGAKNRTRDLEGEVDELAEEVEGVLKIEDGDSESDADDEVDHSSRGATAQTDEKGEGFGNRKGESGEATESTEQRGTVGGDEKQVSAEDTAGTSSEQPPRPEQAERAGGEVAREDKTAAPDMSKDIPGEEKLAQPAFHSKAEDEKSVRDLPGGRSEL